MNSCSVYRASTNRFVVIMTTLLVLFLPAASHAADSLQDLDGQKTTLQEHTGKGLWTVVMIWASDCYVCNAEAHQYIDFHMMHSDTDATVLGISMDGRENIDDALRFIDKNGVDFPNLIGEPADVAMLYMKLTGKPWVGTPSFLVFNRKGELRAQQVGAVPPDLIEAFIAREDKDNKLASQAHPVD
jgi:peroxiredoxin